MFLQNYFYLLKKCGEANKGIYTLAQSTQDHKIKSEKQLIDLTKSINFLADKFKEYEVDRPKKNKIIQDLKSEVDSVSTKVEELEKLQDQQEQYSRRSCLLVHWIADDKEETTDKVIINMKKLDLQITLSDIERTLRIEEPNKTRRKTRPIL